MNTIIIMQESEPQNTPWNQYERIIDIYKFYMDLTLKGNIFICGILGSILSYVFASSAQSSNELLLRFGTYFSLGVFSVFAALCGRGTFLAHGLRVKHDQIFQGLDIEKPFSISPLIEILFAFTVFYAVSGLGLFCYLLNT